jgi:hypothetical protein
MTDQQHPIIPPPELVQEWFQKWNCDESTEEADSDIYIATRAAQWGWDQRGANNEAQLQERADQELEACCEWLEDPCAADMFSLAKDLRYSRRPKPPTLNSIALQMLSTIERDAHYLPEITDTLRRALEALPND